MAASDQEVRFLGATPPRRDWRRRAEGASRDLLLKGAVSATEVREAEH